MNFLYKYLAVLSLINPNALLGQANIDSTKPSRYILFCDDRQGSIEKPIHLEWVQIDRDIIRNKVNKLPANGATLTEIKKLIPHFLGVKRIYSSQSITHDLGYGLKSTQHTFYGGYGSYHVDALYFGDDVIKMRLVIGNRREIMEKYLFDEIQLPFDCINGQITYEKTYDENLKKYQKDSGRLFLESVDTIYRRRMAINYFTDVMTGGTFTEPYYAYVGVGCETFNSLRYFIVNKDYTALECILFSPGPTCRLFAARTLMYVRDKFGYRAGKDVDKRMKEVLKNARPIRSGILNCHINKFDYDYYDIVKDFEKFLVTL